MAADWDPVFVDRLPLLEVLVADVVESLPDRGLTLLTQWHQSPAEPAPEPLLRAFWDLPFPKAPLYLSRVLYSVVISEVL